MQTEKQLSLKQKLAFIAVLCLLCSLPVLWVLKERADREAEIQAAKVAAENRKKAVAAAMVDQPQPPKGLKKKMVKIVRGGTEQADFVNELCIAANGDGSFNVGGGEIPAGFDTYWVIGSPEMGINSDNPQGGNVTPTGVVTLPDNFGDGVETATIWIEGGCTPDPPTSQGALQKTFQFEVVCMKVKIRVLPVRK